MPGNILVGRYLNNLKLINKLIQDLQKISAGMQVCCFGEILLRFSPQLHGKFIAQASMPVYIGGAELNVATALARWNIAAKYVTAVPANYLAEEMITEVSNRNINIEGVKFCGERIGSYYLPQGADLKNSGVIYDRANSSFANLKPGDLDWDTILQNVDWFHFSAISPALNPSAAAVCLEAVQAASKKNIPISVDLNYRAKLWQYGKVPLEIMPEIVQYCSLIMGNIWSIEKLLGVKLAADFNPDSKNKEAFLQQAQLSAQGIRQKFSGCQTIANTFRFDEGEGIKYFATMHTKDADLNSLSYAIKTIVDKIGSGDCFMAGLIYGIRQNLSEQNILDFATAAAIGKLQQLGDATTSKIDDIQKIIAANG